MESIKPQANNRSQTIYRPSRLMRVWITTSEAANQKSQRTPRIWSVTRSGCQAMFQTSLINSRGVIVGQDPSRGIRGRHRPAFQTTGQSARFGSWSSRSCEGSRPSRAGRSVQSRCPALLRAWADRERRENARRLVIPSQAIQIAGFPSYLIPPQRCENGGTGPRQWWRMPAFSGPMEPVI